MKDIFWMVSFIWESPELVAIIATLIFAWWVLTIFAWEKGIQKWLDERVPPEKKEVRKRKTQPGVKLYACLKEEYKTTVVWETPITAIAVLAASVVLALAVVIAWQAARWTFDPNIGADPLGVSFAQNLIFWAIVTLSVLVGVPYTYQRRRWIQRNTRVIFTSDKMTIVRGKIGFLQIVRLEADYYISETDIRYMDDIIIAPDPQDISPRFKTSWFRDRWTKYWARRIDVASAYIPARAYGGADFVTFLEGANEFLQFRDQLHLESDLQNQSRGQYLGHALSVKYQVYSDSGGDMSRARASFEEEASKGNDLLLDIAKPVEYDLFSLEVGVWPNGWGQENRGNSNSTSDTQRKYHDLMPPEGSVPASAGFDNSEDGGEYSSRNEASVPNELMPGREEVLDEDSRRRRYQDLLGPEEVPPLVDESTQTDLSADSTESGESNLSSGTLPEADNHSQAESGLRRAVTRPTKHRGQGSSFLPTKDD